MKIKKIKYNSRKEIVVKVEGHMNIRFPIDDIIDLNDLKEKIKTEVNDINNITRMDKYKLLKSKLDGSEINAGN